MQDDPFIVPECDEQIEIIYQDEYFLVFNKPTRLLTLSGKNPLNKDSVHFGLVQKLPTATTAHRLDFGTSGILLVALNKEVNAQSGKHVQNRTITKSYIALLTGNLNNDQGSIDYPVAKDTPNFSLQKSCNETGKSALTHYEVVERNQTQCSTRVIFSVVSGRIHQLRIHS